MVQEEEDGVDCCGEGGEDERGDGAGREGVAGGGDEIVEDGEEAEERGGEGGEKHRVALEEGRVAREVEERGAGVAGCEERDDEDGEHVGREAELGALVVG